MNDIDNVMDGLYRLKSDLRVMCAGITEEYYENSMKSVDNAIQTIRELQAQNKHLLEDNAELHDDIQSLNVFYQEALEKIPKWHLCSDELPTGEQYRANNGQFIVTNGQKVYAEWFDIYDTKTFGEPTISRFRTDRSVIAWTELPKFESEE